MSRTYVEDPVYQLSASVSVSYLTSGSVDLTWAVRDDFCQSLPYLTFDVLRGESASDQMQVIGTTTEHSFTDNQPNRLDESLSLWYAVRTTDIRTNKKWYTPPTQLGCAWDVNDWRIARDIVRAFDRRMRQGRAGTLGYLLQRKKNGPTCPVCVDVDTGQVADPDCPTCWGTGIVGGYHLPIPMWIDIQPEKVMRKLDGERGMIAQTVSSAISLAYPNVSTGDYWVNQTSGVILQVLSDIAVTAHIRGIPLMVQFGTTVEKSNHPIYKFPLP